MNQPSDMWKYVNRSGLSDCWNWLNSTKAGYGTFTANNVTKSTHVWAYILTYGAVPFGLQVQHSCNNKLCCNPQHLTVGTVSKNAKDAIAAGLPWGKGPGSSGIKGVYSLRQKGHWQARVDRKYGTACLYSGRDFFEACCARKSWENSI